MESPAPARVLLLPGWQNSGPQHWQSRWEALYGDLRVEQHDWMHPLRGDWVMRLEEVVQAQAKEVVLVAHSLGCLLVAAWAAQTRLSHRVRGALLVAPGDPQQPELAACSAAATTLIAVWRVRRVFARPWTRIGWTAATRATSTPTPVWATGRTGARC